MINVVIDRAGYHSKIQQEKTTLQVFLVLFTRPVSPSGIYGTLLVLLLIVHYSRAFAFNLLAWNCKLYSAADCLHACAK